MNLEIQRVFSTMWSLLGDVSQSVSVDHMLSQLFSGVVTPRLWHQIPDTPLVELRVADETH